MLLTNLLLLFTQKAAAGMKYVCHTDIKKEYGQSCDYHGNKQWFIFFCPISAAAQGKLHDISFTQQETFLMNVPGI